MPGRQVKEKEFYMFRSGFQINKQTNKQTSTHAQNNENKQT